MGDCLPEEKRRVIRVYVEPVELELEDDDSLLISSLQSALPGASGLYYNGEYKSSIKFDGKKLLPPGDGWSDRRYFATLGARSFDYPFGSYANASKQFERSVEAVERILGGDKTFGVSVRREKNLPQNMPMAADKAENMKQLLASFSQKPTRTVSPDKQRRSNTPLEKQFVDLARISTAKDTIIEQQRTDIKNLEEKFNGCERALKEALENLSKSEDKCNALEEELALLKKLGTEQTYLGHEVNELRQAAKTNEQTIEKQAAEISSLLKKIEQYECHEVETAKRMELLEKNSLAAEDRGHDLQHQLEDLQLKSDTAEMKYAKTFSQLTAAREQNERLENDLSILDEKFKHVNQIYSEIFNENTKFRTKCQEYEASVSPQRSTTEDDRMDAFISALKRENEELRKEMSAYDEKFESLSKMVETLSTEAIQSEHRARKAELTCNEMKRQANQADFKKQEALAEERKKADCLQLDLEDAQAKIAELTLFVGNLSGA